MSTTVDKLYVVCSILAAAKVFPYELEQTWENSFKAYFPCDSPALADAPCAVKAAFSRAAVELVDVDLIQHVDGSVAVRFTLLD